MKKMLCLLPLVSLMAVSAWALDDTPENRGKEADRYLQVAPLQETMADISAKLAQQIPEKQRAVFIEAMQKQVDYAKLKQASRQAMMKHFTADELKALADFYSSEAGRSAIKKMGDYTVELMPVIQAEMAKALAAAEKSINKKPASATKDAKPETLTVVDEKAKKK
jgi:hypothetical protein